MALVCTARTICFLLYCHYSQVLGVRLPLHQPGDQGGVLHLLWLHHARSAHSGNRAGFIRNLSIRIVLLAPGEITEHLNDIGYYVS